MVRSTTAAIAFGASLWAFAALGLVGQPLVRAAMAVGIGIAVTAFAYGQAGFLAIGIGALSPLAFALLHKHSLGMAAAALCLFWLLPRLVLAESKGRLAALAAASTGAATVAGFIFAAYADDPGKSPTGGAPWAAQAASCLFAGSCLSLVLLLPVDSGLSFALRSAASAIEGASRETLERAARAYRQPSTRGKAKQWRRLVRLADDRASLETSKGQESDASREDLDRRIAELAEELALLPKASSSPGCLNEPPGPEVSSQPDAQSPADMAAE